MLFKLEELPASLRAQAEIELEQAPTVFDDPFPDSVLEGDGKTRIWIPGNVPSLKNNKRIVSIGPKDNRRPMLVPSKRHEEYKKATAIHWQRGARPFIMAANRLSKPLEVGFRFVRGSRHRFDYTNALDTVQDLMVEFMWIEDDNADEIIPELIPYRYDKERPGVEIVV